MGRLLCRLFGHRWREKYEYSGRLVPRPMLMSFGFEVRLFPMLMPEHRRTVGLFCDRCGAPKEAPQK